MLKNGSTNFYVNDKQIAYQFGMHILHNILFKTLITLASYIYLDDKVKPILFAWYPIFEFVDNVNEISHYLGERSSNFL